MKIVIIGANGSVGRHLVREALDRQHTVLSAVRSPGYLAAHSRVSTHIVDVDEPDALMPLLAEADIAISALRPPAGREHELASLTNHVLDAAAAAGRRVIVCGGAARLRITPSTLDTVLTAPGRLPPSIRPIAEACMAQYAVCLEHPDADWTYISPPEQLHDGKRTGQYRLGSDVLVMREDGRSEISLGDFAIAILDEAEASSHRRMAFTVGW